MTIKMPSKNSGKVATATIPRHNVALINKAIVTKQPEAA